MSNSKGNQYICWYITSNLQVFSLSLDGVSTQQSVENFAMNIAVSEDGTVWVVSDIPDPDGGGAKIYWSNGDSNWNQIDNAAPGGVSIAGGIGSSCYFITSKGDLWKMDTNGEGALVDDKYNYLAFDYGGGYYWGLFSDEHGTIPHLHYASSSDLNWQLFGKQAGKKSQPVSITALPTGNCYGLERGTPHYYLNDGEEGKFGGESIEGIAIQISSKSATYAVTSKLVKKGSTYVNQIMSFTPNGGGTFEDAPAYGIKVASTYMKP